MNKRKKNKIIKLLLKIVLELEETKDREQTNKEGYLTEIEFEELMSYISEIYEVIIDD